MNTDNQTKRTEVLRRLEQQRQRIESLFTKPDVPRTGMSHAVKNGFPRSQTMRLLISEPMFTAGLKTLMAHLLGPRAPQLLHALASAFRAAQNVSQKREPRAP